MKYASISAKHTADSYIKEQAELYLNSSIEKVLLDISKRDRKKDGYLVLKEYHYEKRKVKYTADINITRYYLLEGSEDINYCKNKDECDRRIKIETEETHGMVMLEAEVTVNVDSKERVRILRRTLQRP
jgi:hypothetical protein